MTTHAPPNVTNLIDLLTEQRDLYTELRTLSDRQTAIIEQGETDALLGLLSQRQGLVDELGRVNGELSPYRTSWDAADEAIPQDSRDRVRGLLEEVEALLADILAQDDRAQQQLRAAQQRIGGELTNVSRAGSAIHAYRGAASSHEARFTDHRG